jgi:hypothetical protein
MTTRTEQVALRGTIAGERDTLGERAGFTAGRDFTVPLPTDIPEGIASAAKIFPPRPFALVGRVCAMQYARLIALCTTLTRSGEDCLRSWHKVGIHACGHAL